MNRRNIVRPKPPRSSAAVRRQASAAPESLPGFNESPSRRETDLQTILMARSPAFDGGLPAYILDNNYFFLEWNTAFEHLVARPLNLKRRESHAADFVRELKNQTDVVNRSNAVFSRGREPLVDTEQLIFESDLYKTVEFTKIATQILDDNAKRRGWHVTLNISRADQAEALWKALKEKLEIDEGWNKYAVSYDKLLLNFRAYHDLLRRLLKGIGKCKRVADVGAGTGNMTLELLKLRGIEEVAAVEPRISMWRQLYEKVKREPELLPRLRVVNEELAKLRGSELLLAGSYDGVILMNVLYACDEPVECLRVVKDLLRPGGKLVLSTPHSVTDVDELFAAMKDELVQKELWDTLQSNWADALHRHKAEEMDRLIHRDTPEKVHWYLKEAGFKVRSFDIEKAYVDAVIVVEAERP